MSQIAENMPKYTMGIMASLTGATDSWLRRLEGTGIIKPHRTGTGQRLYTDNEFAIITKCLTWKEQGINFAGMRELLKLEGNHEV